MDKEEVYEFVDELISNLHMYEPISESANPIKGQMLDKKIEFTDKKPPYKPKVFYPEHLKEKSFLEYLLSAKEDESC